MAPASYHACQGFEEGFHPIEKTIDNDEYREKGNHAFEEPVEDFNDDSGYVGGFVGETVEEPSSPIDENRDLPSSFQPSGIQDKPNALGLSSDPGLENVVLEPPITNHSQACTMPGQIGSPSSKRSITELTDEEENDSKPSKTNMRARRTGPSPTSFSPQQEQILVASRDLWESENREPSANDLQRLADLARLPLCRVWSWFRERTELLPAEPPASAARPTPANDPTILEEVAVYNSEVRSKSCNPSSNAGRSGRFPCTLHCSYATDSEFDWKRHEHSRQPQDFWHCVTCRSMYRSDAESGPFIHHRLDKFRKHARDKHGVESGTELTSLCDASRVDYSAGFEEQCRFILEGGARCPRAFQSWSWDARNKHYLQHYRDRASSDPWYGSGFDGGGPGGAERYSKYSPGDKSLGGDGRSGSRGVSDGKASGHASGGNSFGQGYWCKFSFTIGESSSLERPLLSMGLSAAAKLPEKCSRKLFDVIKNELVIASAHAQFLALTWSGSSVMHSNTSKSDTSERVVEKSARLTRAMGFQYLALDLFYSDASSEPETGRTLSQAVMIIIVIESEDAGQGIWHFTCHRRRYEEVSHWAAARVGFQHLRQLGHGAYGIVDEVELTSSKHVFARKIIFDNNASPEHAPRAWRPLQEVAMLQKFDHPHIAHFVAAYSDSRTFNILMDPVADCDLRQYLNDPDQYPGKRKHIPRWMLSLASAVAYIHDLKCRHKDIKPANILISKDNVLLSDFGTSGGFENDDSRSVGGAFMTPKYCGPEVARQEARGRKADVFSLGCVFVEMLIIAQGYMLDNFQAAVGLRRPANGRGFMYHEHQSTIVKGLVALSVRTMDVTLFTETQVCLKMLHIDPAQRPSAIEVVRALSCDPEWSLNTADSTCACCSSGDTSHNSYDPALRTYSRPTPQYRSALSRKTSFEEPSLHSFLMPYGALGNIVQSPPLDGCRRMSLAPADGPTLPVVLKYHETVISIDATARRPWQCACTRTALNDTITPDDHLEQDLLRPQLATSTNHPTISKLPLPAQSNKISELSRLVTVLDSKCLRQLLGRSSYDEENYRSPLNICTAVEVLKGCSTFIHVKPGALVDFIKRLRIVGKLLGMDAWFVS